MPQKVGIVYSFAVLAWWIEQDFGRDLRPEPKQDRSWIRAVSLFAPSIYFGTLTSCKWEQQHTENCLGSNSWIQRGIRKVLHPMYSIYPAVTRSMDAPKSRLLYLYDSLNFWYLYSSSRVLLYASPEPFLCWWTVISGRQSKHVTSSIVIAWYAAASSASNY